MGQSGSYFQVYGDNDQEIMNVPGHIDGLDDSLKRHHAMHPMMGGAHYGHTKKKSMNKDLSDLGYSFGEAALSLF